MKKTINSLLKRFGYQIRATHSPIQSFEDGVRQIAEQFEIEAIIDVGVAHNTNALYRPFNDKRFLLIEANPAFKEYLEKIKGEYNAVVEMVFCGSESGEMTITIPENHRRSTAYGVEKGKQQRVKMETLDTLSRRHKFNQKNLLLKIDVEGSELNVLEGGPETLQVADVVILEVCWGVPFAEGATDYADLIMYMKRAGFELFNIIEGGGILTKGRLTHADFVFVKKSKI